jgi:hypothetical protein
MNFSDLVTARINSRLPKRKLADLRFEHDAIYYLHPTKGWKRVSYRRLGVKLYGAADVVPAPRG